MGLRRILAGFLLLVLAFASSARPEALCPAMAQGTPCTQAALATALPVGLWLCHSAGQKRARYSTPAVLPQGPWVGLWEAGALGLGPKPWLEAQGAWGLPVKQEGAALQGPRAPPIPPPQA